MYPESDLLLVSYSIKLGFECKVVGFCTILLQWLEVIACGVEMRPIGVKLYEKRGTNYCPAQLFICGICPLVYIVHLRIFEEGVLRYVGKSRYITIPERITISPLSARLIQTDQSRFDLFHGGIDVPRSTSIEITLIPLHDTYGNR